ncbi:MAG: TolC family protein [Flavobacteriales bacterium]
MNSFLKTLIFTAIAIGLFNRTTGQTLYEAEDFLQQVWEHHPIVQAAGLRSDRANAQWQKARGGFDPELNVATRSKNWNETLYYRQDQAELNIPTPLGLDVEIGYLAADGTYLNPEWTAPDGGLLQAGIKVQLGQGLRIDARRAALQKAKLALDLGEVERRHMLNAVSAEALNAYWNWFDAWHSVAVFENSVAIAEQRRLAVIQSATQGDRPALDTLEASIQVLNRRENLLEAQQHLVKTAALMESFLWGADNAPLGLNPGVRPPDLIAARSALALPPVRSEWEEQHPEILKGQNVISQSEVDLNWRKEQLKPELGLKYQWIDDARSFPNESTWDPVPATFGVDFAFPLFIRAERGAVRMAEVDLTTRGLALTEKRRVLRLKSEALRAAGPLLLEQLNVQTQAVRESEQLLNGERALFQAGESSLFLINMREQYFIQTQLKAIAILHKLANNRIEIAETEASWW